MKMVRVEVVFAQPHAQPLQQLVLLEGSTARQALAQCGMDVLLDDSSAPLVLACFGRRIAPDQRLSEGDRIELLRPLIADPKDQRHARVKAAQRQSARAAQRSRVV